MTLKHSKQAKTIILRQLEVISSLLGRKVKLDLYGNWLLELNYYLDLPYDEMKGQRHVVRASLSTEEEPLIFELQNIIDVMYLMKFGEPCPHEMYFPNKYAEYIMERDKYKKKKIPRGKEWIPLK